MGVLLCYIVMQNHAYTLYWGVQFSRPRLSHTHVKSYIKFQKNGSKLSFQAVSVVE